MTDWHNLSDQLEDSNTDLTNLRNVVNDIVARADGDMLVSLLFTAADDESLVTADNHQAIAEFAASLEQPTGLTDHQHWQQEHDARMFRGEFA